MENQLTPSKIERLINLAQGCPNQLQEFFKKDFLGKLDDKQLESLASIATQDSKSNTNGESSSGILDLEFCEGFGESQSSSLSINKSTSFNPGEMTGRSTEAEDLGSQNVPELVGKGQSAKKPPFTMKNSTWSTEVLNDMVDKLNKQTSDINEIMRNSIASGYSFNSHRDLTADEASLVAREAVLPVPQSEINFNLTRNTNQKDISRISTMSVGTYFQNRCSEFGAILPRTQSPHYDYSMGPNLLESDMSITQPDQTPKKHNPKLDASLDCVPVRQPRPVRLPTQIPSTPRIPTTLPSISEHIAPKIPPFPGTITKTPINPLFADPKKQHLIAQNVTVDSSQEESSFNISAIASYLQLDGDIMRPSIILKQIKHDKKGATNEKEPLSTLTENVENLHIKNDDFVVKLKDTERADTASSMATVIATDKNKANKENCDNIMKIPAVVVSRDSLAKSEVERSSLKTDRSTSARSKSLASKSRSTCSTVQENFLSASYRSENSPMQTNKSKEENVISEIPSSNVHYRELDKSVDWQEVLLQKRPMREGLAKVSLPEDWAEVNVNAVSGFVGVTVETTITVTTRTDSWLTAHLEINKPSINEKDIIVDLPRSPMLLSPRKPEQFVIRLTPNVAMNASIKFSLKLKDASIDTEIVQLGEMNVNFKLPVLQTITSDGFNNGISFGPTQEGKVLKKALVLISDCPADLLLDLTVTEGSSMFTISNVQEIKRTDVKASLSELYPNVDEGTYSNKYKPLKPTNKQSCKLSAGNAIRALITFTAPKLSDLKMKDKQAGFNASMSVNIIGTSTVIRKIEMTAAVGVVDLELVVPSDKLHITNGSTIVKIANKGTIVGTWAVKLKVDNGCHSNQDLFKVCSNKVDIYPGTDAHVVLQYLGPLTEYNESVISFEDVVSKNETNLMISGGKLPTKTFPIKTTLGEMSWVCEGRKEISLKNYSDKKVNVKCKIVGNGFVMETPRVSGTDLVLTFSPTECRSITVVFKPTSMQPHKAKLLISMENETETGKSVRLHGCGAGGAGGGGALRWAGLVTYGDTALVPAVRRQPVLLTLRNAAAHPAFLSATVHFNLQYVGVARTSPLEGARAVVAGRGTARVTLALDWARVERRARDAGRATLATVRVLAGAEVTRRRILRILKEESNGKLDESTLPDHLKPLTGKFDGEDPALDESLQDFQETGKSMDVLLTGLQELTAQIDLQVDFADHTIFIPDDTVLEHHTLCD